MSQPSKRILVAIPAYNEAGTIAGVVASVPASLPSCDLLVVNDGSGAETGQILETLNTTVATHLCNLGYGEPARLRERLPRLAFNEACMVL